MDYSMDCSFLISMSYLHMDVTAQARLAGRPEIQSAAAQSRGAAEPGFFPWFLWWWFYWRFDP